MYFEATNFSYSESSFKIDPRHIFNLLHFIFQRQKKLVEEEEQKQLLEKRAQYIEATKNLLKFSHAAEVAKTKAGKKVCFYSI